MLESEETYDSVEVYLLVYTCIPQSQKKLFLSWIPTADNVVAIDNIEVEKCYLKRQEIKMIQNMDEKSLKPFISIQ